MHCFAFFLWSHWGSGLEWITRSDINKCRLFPDQHGWQTPQLPLRNKAGFEILYSKQKAYSSKRKGSKSPCEWQITITLWLSSVSTFRSAISDSIFTKYSGRFFTQHNKAATLLLRGKLPSTSQHNIPHFSPETGCVSLCHPSQTGIENTRFRRSD